MKLRRGDRRMSNHSDTATAADVLAFWREAGPDKWYAKDETFDAEIRAKFLGVYDAAAAGKFDAWEATAEGALALVIVLDQFPRNMFRGQARCFTADPAARAVANRALKRGYEQDVPEAERGFFFLPFMHSEDIVDQDRCVALYREAGDTNLKYALEHHDIIRRFGRFPHRNAALGRPTSAEEQAFLDAGGFGG
jgi:uncharacterized protein (DUF924 family)